MLYEIYKAHEKAAKKLGKKELIEEIEKLNKELSTIDVTEHCMDRYIQPFSDDEHRESLRQNEKNRAARAWRKVDEIRDIRIIYKIELEKRG